MARLTLFLFGAGHVFDKIMYLKNCFLSAIDSHLMLHQVHEMLFVVRNNLTNNLRCLVRVVSTNLSVNVLVVELVRESADPRFSA